MRVLLLGGTRFLGRRLAEMLVADGCEVFVATRGKTGTPPGGTTGVRFDRETGTGIETLPELRPDTVVDLSGYRSAWVEDAISAVGRPRPHYVFVSSGAVYRPDAELPWAENQAMGPSPIWGDYAREKLLAEEALWRAHAEGRIDATVFRFPFVMGPGNYADREAFLFSRILAGRPVLLPGGGDAINQLIHMDDGAEAMRLAIGRRERSSGYAFNCGLPRAITNRGLAECCAGLLGVEADLVATDPGAHGEPGRSFDLTDIVFPFPDSHYFLDPSFLRERLGFEARRGTVQILSDFLAGWDRNEPPRTYPAEERALARSPQGGAAGGGTGR